MTSTRALNLFSLCKNGRNADIVTQENCSMEFISSMEGKTGISYCLTDLAPGAKSDCGFGSGRQIPWELKRHDSAGWPTVVKDQKAAYEWKLNKLLSDELG